MTSYAEYNLRVAQMMKFTFDTAGNIVRKAENAVTSIFSFSHYVLNIFLSHGVRIRIFVDKG